MEQGKTLGESYPRPIKEKYANNKVAHLSKASILGKALP